MTVYVEIAVNIPQVTGAFHYHIPAELEGAVKAGHLVVVPFGKQRVQGVVLRQIDQPEVSETRPVIELVDPDAVLTPAQLELARYLSERFLAPVATCIALMLPPGLSQLADVIYSAQTQNYRELTRNQRRLLDLLQRKGPQRGSQIDRSLKHINWRASARSLVKKGLLNTQSTLPAPRVRPKRVRMVELRCSPQQAAEAMPGLARAGSVALQRRQAALGLIMQEDGPVNVSRVYAGSGANLNDLRKLEEMDLVSIRERQVWRDPLDKYVFVPDTPPKLTGDQQKVLTEIEASLRAVQAGVETKPLLLHGVNGSGKTEIYLKAVELVLSMGKQAIVLVPEISLTPQTVKRFLNRFPGLVGLLHSGLSQGERYDTWRRARIGELRIVVGPRSALFVPFSNPGIIILDECHDDSYYQSEPQPYYQSGLAAVEYARYCGAACLMGSATPNVSSIQACENGEWRYLELPARILAHRDAVSSQLERLGKTGARFHYLEGEVQGADLPAVSVVDMRRELKEGNRSIFSRELFNSLERVLSDKLQAILFLNRRGAATYVFCRDCGHSLKCPRCETPLIFHTYRKEDLQCHRCGYRRNMPRRCPKCGSTRIRQYGTGTQKVEAEVQRLFPKGKPIRWDHETTRKKGSHEYILEEFISQRANILVGTQMLAKGLDLPFVTLVGVILADVGLNLPDYRAGERTFQVLTQVAGRAGRSPLGGEVILQTFQPEHYVIQAASKHDYKQFSEQELEYRRRLAYPPYTNLARMELRNTSFEHVQDESRRMAAVLRRLIAVGGRRATSMIGPAPCFFSRIGGNYRWQIILKGPDPASLLKGQDLGAWKVELNPPSLL
ncbi:MAG: primosomal protein N' [Anaerolineales bacterium]